MCDKELLIDYLYGELAAGEREAFDRHLASCAECRDEVRGCGARARTSSRGRRRSRSSASRSFAAPRGRCRCRAAGGGLSPAWGLAAAAMLVGAVSAAIAHVEVSADTGGITVRTGWNRTVAAAGSRGGRDGVHGSTCSASRPACTSWKRSWPPRRPRADPASVAPIAAVNSRMSDAELLRVVRRLIEDSEARQEGELARRILQVNRDVEVARRTDLDRLGRGMDEIRSTSYEAFRKSKNIRRPVRARRRAAAITRFRSEVGS